MAPAVPMFGLARAVLRLLLRELGALCDGDRVPGQYIGFPDQGSCLQLKSDCAAEAIG